MKDDHAWALFVGTLLIAVWSFLAAFPARAETLEEVTASPETFAVCKAADIGTTAYILAHGGVENNPVVAWSLRVGGWAPLVFASIGIYWAMTKWGTPASNTVVNGVTCGVALKNLTQIP